MRKFLNIFSILVFLFVMISGTPLPFGLPNPKSTAYYEIGWMQSDSGMIAAKRDTTMTAKYAGTFFMWQHAGVDTNVWFNDGARYFHYVKSGADVITALGYTPLANITGFIQQGSNVIITGLGTLGNPYVISATGGGPGGISSINSQTGPAITLATGSAGTDFGITQSTNTITFNLPTGSASNRGLISPTDWSTFNGKQAQLNGTGFVKATGTTISYDNSTYYLASNPNNYITLNSLSANTPIVYNSSTGVISADTSTGLTKLATQAYVLAHQSSGTITGAGNLSPLFTTSVASNTIVFALSNVSPHLFYGNFTGSTTTPSFSSPTLASADFANQGTSTTTLHGNASGNPSWALVNLSTDVSNTLPAANGGTGNNTYTIGDLLYASSSSALSRLADVAVNQVLNSGGVGVAPSWGSLPFAAITALNASSLLGNPTVGSATPVNIPLGYGLKFSGGALALDSAHLHDTTFIKYKGTPGDTLLYATGSDTIYSFRFSDSAGFHHYFKSDGTLIMYSTGGGGFSDPMTTAYDIIYRNGSNVTTRLGVGANNTVLGVQGGVLAYYGLSSFYSPTYINSGTSSTIGAGDVTVIFTFSSTAPVYTLTMPASPNNGQIIRIQAAGPHGAGTIVTNLTISPNSGQSFAAASLPNTILFGESYGFRWDNSLSQWIAL